MKRIGLKELRQHASHYVKRAGEGERLEITVSGRPSAILAPPQSDAWRAWDDVAHLFQDQPADPDWATDRDRLPDEMRNPWGDS